VLWKRPAPAVSVEGHPHGNGRRLNVAPHNRRASLIEGGASECDAGAPFVENQHWRLRGADRLANAPERAS
jgi:hypothetical protein